MCKQSISWFRIKNLEIFVGLVHIIMHKVNSLLLTTSAGAEQLYSSVRKVLSEDVLYLLPDCFTLCEGFLIELEGLDQDTHLILNLWVQQQPLTISLGNSHLIFRFVFPPKAKNITRSNFNKN